MSQERSGIEVASRKRLVRIKAPSEQAQKKRGVSPGRNLIRKNLQESRPLLGSALCALRQQASKRNCWLPARKPSAVRKTLNSGTFSFQVQRGLFLDTSRDMVFPKAASKARPYNNKNKTGAGYAVASILVKYLSRF